MARSIINTSSKGDKVKQGAATPWPFIRALSYRFGTLVDFDLAASKSNAKAPAFFTEKDDALKQDWSAIQTVKGKPVQLAYCNPPFADIEPWANKLIDCRYLRRWTVCLWPASFSCRWWNEVLVGKVQIDAIPRIQFIGQKHLFPKDLAIAVAGFGVVGGGYWDWRVSARNFEQRDKQPLYFPDLRSTMNPFAKG